MCHRVWPDRRCRRALYYFDRDFETQCADLSTTNWIRYRTLCGTAHILHVDRFGSARPKSIPRQHRTYNRVSTSPIFKLNHSKALYLATMNDASVQPAHYAAPAILKYTHAPAVAFYFLGTCACQLCGFQKPKRKPIPHKRRRGILVLAAATLLTYITEALYYFSRSLAQAGYEPPRPAAIRCLDSILT